MTECNVEQLEFHGLGRRAVVGRFDGGTISSDGGVMLLSEVEAKTRIIERLAESEKSGTYHGIAQAIRGRGRSNRRHLVTTSSCWPG